MKADLHLAGAFLAAHPVEAAPVLEHASADSSAAVLLRSEPAVIAGVLQRMAPEEGAALMARLPAAQVPGVLERLSLGAAALMLRKLGTADRARLLASASEETARSLHTALLQPEGTAGSMMDAGFVAFPLEISVGEAHRRTRRRTETGNYAYVVDEQRRLVGVVALSELMRASPDMGLTSIMRPSVVRLPAQAKERTILEHAGWRELHAIPVVDSEDVLVGVLRRETYERLRADRDERGVENSAGMGMALAELVWASMISAVDGFARASRSDSSVPRTEGEDGP